MRAVNLIPREERRGGHGAPGRSGGAVYILLGALSILVVALAAYVLTNNSIQDKKAELAKVTNETTAAEAQAAALRPYREFASLKQTRATTVASLAGSRFDWERVMRQLAIVLPSDVWLTSVVGTVAPGVAFSGGGSGSGGGTGSLRSAMQSPAIELLGCTVNQAEVSRVMVRLRQMDGVTRVSLGSSEKVANAAGSTSGAGGNGASSGGGGGGGDCRGGNSKFPQFQMVVFFNALAGTPAAGSTGSAAAPQTQAPPSSSEKAKSAVSTTGGKP
jgi:Tfp pilus assembly protein PilN